MSSGGMTTKLEAAELCMKNNIIMVIAHISSDLVKIVAGDRSIGTWFL